MLPVVVNTFVSVVVWTAVESIGVVEVVLLLMSLEVDEDRPIGMEVNPGWMLFVFVIIKLEAVAEDAAALGKELVVIVDEAFTGIELRPLTMLPDVVATVSVLGCRLSVVKPPVGPVKVAEAVTKMMTMLLGLDGVEVEAVAAVSEDAALLPLDVDDCPLRGTTMLAGSEAAALGVLLSVEVDVDPDATEKNEVEAEVCGSALLLAVLELCNPTKDKDALKVVLAAALPVALWVSSGGKACVTFKVVATVVMMVVCAFTVTAVGSADSEFCELALVAVVSELGKAGIGNIVVDCASVRSDTPDASCLLRNFSSDPPGSPLTTHLRCSSFACRNTLFLLPLWIGPADVKAISKNKHEVERRILVDS